MSITQVRPYFRARAKEQGWKEWLDAFGANNIPANLIDQSFHLQFRGIGSSKTNQTDTEINIPIEVKFFRKGFTNVAAGLDDAAKRSENFILSCLMSSNRLNAGTGIKNVWLQSLEFAQFEANNNLVMVTMVFTCLVILGTT